MAPQVSRLGNIYTVTGSFTGGILDERNGSIVNGSGYTVTTGLGVFDGVEVLDANSVTIQDFDISSVQYAFYIEGSINVKISDSQLTSATQGTYIDQSNGVDLLGNDLAGSGGIFSYYTSNELVDDNNVSASTFGVYMAYGNNLTVEHNTAVGDGDPLQFYDDSNLVVFANSVSGGWDIGIYAQIVSQFEITWNNFSGGGISGILAQSAELGSIANNSFTGGFGTGIDLESDASLNVTNNDFADAGIAVYALWQEFLNVTANDLAGATGDAVFAEYLFDANFSSNDASAAFNYSFEIEYSTGIVLWQNDADSPTDDVAIYSYENGQLSVVNNSVEHAPHGGFSDEKSNGLIIRGNTFSGVTGGPAISLFNDQHAIVEDNQAVDSYYGLFLDYTIGAQVTGNDFSTATEDGIFADAVTDAQFTQNRLNGCLQEGLYVFDSIGVSVVDVSALSVAAGDALDIEGSADVVVVNTAASSPADDAAYLYRDAGVELANDNLSNSEYGLYLEGNSNLTVFGSTFFGDAYSFYLDGGGANLLYHNNFVDDDGWANVLVTGANFAWDNGYPIGGNFWSNDTSPDARGGPGQDLPGPDGIVDTPVVVNATNIDHFPLTAPWSVHSITFVESGLPTGTPWSVAVNGTTVTSSSSTVVYDQPNGAYSEYSYSVSAIAGYRANPSNGTSSPIRTNPVIAISFSTVNYSVTFTETGLVAGTSWTVTLGATAATSAATTIVVSVPNGTYTYTVRGVPNYALSGGSGTAIVAGGPAAEAVTFSLVTYLITFSESGLPSGTGWSVTLGSHVENSTVGSIVFSESNGTYAYSVGGTTGLTATPSNGSQAVQGGGATVTIVFTRSGTTAISTTLYDGLLVGLIALAVLAALGFALWIRGRRSKPNPTATSSTPPPGTGGAPGAPPSVDGPTPPPGVSGGS